MPRTGPIALAAALAVSLTGCSGRSVRPETVEPERTACITSIQELACPEWTDASAEAFERGWEYRYERDKRDALNRGTHRLCASAAATYLAALKRCLPYPE